MVKLGITLAALLFLLGYLGPSWASSATKKKAPEGAKPETYSAHEPTEPKPKASLMPVGQPVKSVQSPLLDEVEKKYAASKTLSATFLQKEFVAALEVTKESSGRISIQRPNLFRWEVEKPHASLLVSDGKKAWFYTPPFDSSDSGQVIIQEGSPLQSRLAMAILSGAFSTTQDVFVEKKSNTEFKLTPKNTKKTGRFESILISIDPKEKLIQKITIHHLGGNKSEVMLSEVKLGPSFQSKNFIFDIPKGTQVIRK